MEIVIPFTSTLKNMILFYARACTVHILYSVLCPVVCTSFVIEKRKYLFAYQLEVIRLNAIIAIERIFVIPEVQRIV